MTFSIVARCPDSGQFGMAVSSSSPAVAARCAHARAAVGAVASQNVTDPRLGGRTLDAMAAGATAADAVAAVINASDHTAWRQLVAVDCAGRTAIFSGSKVLGTHAEAEAPNVAAAGNLLADAGVPAAMLAAFQKADGALGDKLVAAMLAALEAGGEEGPVHSAGMLVVDDQEWPLADLRCDWSQTCPIAAMAEAWAVYKLQAADYVMRALNPAAAPSYGVPGDA